jgi:stearoyl-CoA desaturase (delta-9 desaturase)
MVLIIAFIILWYSSLFCQTFFQHRYAAHGSFRMNKFWEKFFYLLTYLTQGPSYLSPSAYAIMHRMHHAYTDTEQDPHSPSYSKNVFDMMWKTRVTYMNIYNRKIPVEERFLKNIPVWESFEKIAHSNWSRLAWAGIYIFCFAWFSTSPWLWILLPFALVMGPLHGAIINWYAHKYGYINFKLKNTAHNLLHIDFLMLGESYHNNHHQYPSSSNFGKRWHEIDPVYPVIKLLSWMKIISLKNNMMAE